MKWSITEPRIKRNGCIIGLPGRAVSNELMENFCSLMEIPSAMIVCFEPDDYKWYPQPFGAHDQEDAVAGMKESVAKLYSKINKIQKMFRLKRNKIALVGYSAGAVMAIQIAMRSPDPFAACVSVAGAILEPKDVVEAQNQTPILLRHAIDDDCFKWEERYLPMKQALVNNNYNVYSSEKRYGGHSIGLKDAQISGEFIQQYL